MPNHEGFRREEYRSGLGNIRKGAEVYGSDNKKIGEVDDIGPDYIHIKKGFLFPTELCIPNSGVSTSEANKVYLNVPSNRIEQMGWTKCPTHPEMRTGERYAEREEETRIPVREEELEVHKRMAKTGEVEVRKEVTEERETMEVPVVHEDVEIERRKVERPSEEPIRGGETTRIPVSEEEVEVEKHPVIKEELVIKKHPHVEEKKITEPVRKEHVEVERHGETRHEERGFAPERPGYEPERRGHEPGAAGLAYSNIQKGWDVYCSDNKKLGDVDDITADYLLIKKGFFFGENIYVPKNAIDHIERDKVFLNVTCDKIKTLDWNRPRGGGTKLGL